MKLWVDDIREAPKGWLWAKTVKEAKMLIREYYLHLDEISLDHDAGDYVKDGGDYIEILNWMEWIQNTTTDFAFYNVVLHVHSQNVVGKTNMEAIIRRNGWRYE